MIFDQRVASCEGFRRSDRLDICSDCDGPRLAHAGYSSAEISALRAEAISAAARLLDFGCACAVAEGSRVDLHKPDCPYRVLIVVNGLLSRAAVTARRGAATTG